MEANPGCVNDMDSYELTPLLPEILLIKSVPLIQWLVNERGADVNNGNRDGGAPLHLATSVDVVDCLLDCGADPTPPDSSGYTPLMAQTLSAIII